jgi:hypothetical protein
MTIEFTGPTEMPASGPPDALRQKNVQTQAPDTKVLITEAAVALGTAAAASVRPPEHRWVTPLRRIFAASEQSRSKPRPDRSRLAYLESPRMAREMERL